MVYTIFNIIFVVISLVIILIGILWKKKEENEKSKDIYDKIKEFFNKYYKLLIVILFLLTMFTSLYKIGEVPYGMHVDEAGMAYDAYSLSEYGVDRYLNKFPVYLTNYGGGQSAMYAYLVAFFIKIFGLNMISIRLPAIIFRLLIFICGLSIIKNEKSKLKSFIFMFLLTIVPYFIMQSRFGLDCNLLVSFITIAVCFFIQAVKTESNGRLIISGIFFGLSLYTYALSYIIIPILLLFICVYLFYIKKMNIKKLIILGIPIFLLALPLILMILVNNGIINEVTGIITIPKLKDYRGTEVSLKNIINNLYIIPSILSFDNKKIFNDILIYNSISYFGTIYYFTIPFFILGFIKGCKEFYKSLRNKEFNINVIFIFWFFSVLICQLLILEPNINKANAIFVPIIYFATIGIYETIKKMKLLIIPISLILLINFGLFFNYYFYQYNDATKGQFFFATHYLDAIEYSQNLGREHIYIARDLTAQEHIYILLDNKISPYDYKEDNIETTYNNNKITYTFNIPEELDSNNVYIIGSDETLFNKFKDLGFNEMRFGGLTVFSK